MFRKLIFFFLFASVGAFFAGNFVIGKAATRLINMSSHFTAPGFELKLSHAKVNLFGGVLDLQRPVIKNSSDENSGFYRFKRLFVDIDVLKLLDRKLVVERILATDAKFLFIKHEPGQKQQEPDFTDTDEEPQENQTATQATQPEPSDTSTKQPQTRNKIEEKDEPARNNGIDYSSIIGVLLKRLECTAVIEFEDKTVNPNFKQALKVRLQAKDLSTYPVPGTDAGIIALRGSLKNRPRLFVINAKVTVPPVTNPHRADFELEATVRRIDLDIFAPYLLNSGLTDGTMEIEAKIVCRNGEYVRNKSAIKTRITNIKFSDETLSRMPEEVKIPKELKFTSHVYGPFDEPQTDFAASLAGVIINKVLHTSLAELLKKQMNK